MKDMDDIKDSDIFGDYEEWETCVDYEFYMDPEYCDREMKRQYKIDWNKKRNIVRDKRGRLNKGALLAKKDNCNEEKILHRYEKGLQVKEIVEELGCSKTTVYRVLNKHGYGK